MGKPEAYVEDYLTTQAEKNGYLCLKFTSPSFSGVPDRILIGHGEVFFIETKARGKTTRPQQNTVIDLMKEHGAVVYVADTREKIDKVLSEHMRGKAYAIDDSSKTLKATGTVIPRRKPKEGSE